LVRVDRIFVSAITLLNRVRKRRAASALRTKPKCGTFLSADSRGMQEEAGEMLIASVGARRLIGSSLRSLLA
jgi:hypothetical protein